MPPKGADEGAMIERFFVGPDALIGPLDGSFRRGNFAACGRRVSFPAMGKKPMAQATLSCPFGAIHLEDRRGTAQDGHFVSIFAVPLEPPLRGTLSC